MKPYPPQPQYPPQSQQYPPTSAAPYPFSGPPISGGAYSAPPAPPTRNRFLMPLIASVAVLVLLIGAIVVVAIVRSSDKQPIAGPSGNPTASASTAAPSAAIDPCLVGTWQAASDRQTQDLPGVGPIVMIGKGEVSHVYPDGRVDDDYSQATPYTGSYSGHTITMVVTGTVHSKISTANGTITVTDAQPNGSVAYTLDGSQVGSAVPLSINPDPTQYTCLNNTATEHTSLYDVTMTKISPNP